jgi:geranylgeranyl reductase family protein
MSKKIVIIGAGPVGCYTARLLKIYGFDPLLIEEHIEVGRPLHCTGLVGEKVFSERRPVKLPTSAILNTINGAVIHLDGQNFVIKRKHVAYVIDREKFDKGLSQGLNILYQNKFLGFEKTESGYIISTDNDNIPADIIIGADGANSLLRKILGQDENIRHFKGLQFRIRTKLKHEDLVGTFLRKPSFFWVVPEGEGIARVGTISDNPFRDLDCFMKEGLVKGTILERFGGLVSIGICQNTVKNNVALVGDAACQLKPLSYGGIYFGLKSAEILASCIRDDKLTEYDALWKQELASEIKMGLKAKDIYNSLNVEELKAVFKLLRSQKNLIEKIGDFESHSRMLLALIKKPQLYSQFGKVLSIIIKKLL